MKERRSAAQSRTQWLALGFAVATGVAVACSSDDSDRPSGGGGEGGEAGQSTGGGGAGVGGSAGTAGTSGASATGGAPVGGAGGEGGGDSAGGGGAGGEAGDEPKASDGFDSSADGWTITGDAQASSVVPDYSGVGGNPDGLISAVDDVTGGVWYFTAPAKYLGDNSDQYGKSLRFDLQVTPITTPFAAPDVELTGAGITLVYDCTPDPGTTWTSYDVPLEESGWTVSALDGEPATEEQFLAVLANTTQLRVRGEFNSGSDTGKLDNVVFGAP